MLQPGGELDLALEPVGVHPGGHRGREQLHHHLPSQPDLGREEDMAHPPTAELLLYAVRVAQGGLQSVFQVGHGTMIGGLCRFCTPAAPGTRGTSVCAPRRSRLRAPSRLDCTSTLVCHSSARAPAPTATVPRSAFRVSRFQRLAVVPCRHSCRPPAPASRTRSSPPRRPCKGRCPAA